MEETASWKAHSFTLLVFAAIVVLCSIFFVLGMLVGRSQGQRLAETASADAGAKKTPADMKGAPSELTFYKRVETPEANAEPSLEAAPAPAPAAKPKPAGPQAAAPPVAREAAAGSKIFLQVAAISKSNDAARVLQSVKAKGFNTAFILAPFDGEPNPVFRIQIGPYGTITEADQAKRELEAAGFADVLVKK